MQRDGSSNSLNRSSTSLRDSRRSNSGYCAESSAPSSPTAKPSRADRLRHAVVQVRATDIRHTTRAFEDVTELFNADDVSSDSSAHTEPEPLSEPEQDDGGIALQAVSTPKSESESSQARYVKSTFDLEADTLQNIRTSSADAFVPNDAGSDPGSISPKSPKSPPSPSRRSWKHRVLKQSVT
eukprot:TRINITY_DN11486_c0_g2_i1.p1 TRINITY_DN11486_c0_g2~~TRINITY_DN11486_c0_g2_i1.p1  ORF type:complete len:182 (+),score=10.24 TRINITY_DN11486_c0_g2_i1:146-691(+)